MKIIDSAILKLTGWYLLLIMFLSISFSLVLYRVSSHELERGLPRGDSMIMGFFPVSRLEFERYRINQINDSNNRLKTQLLLINLSTLALGGVLSYALARRTLQPITEAMDAQARFTSDASHELKTPLTALHTEIEVALRDDKLTSAQLRAQLRSNLEEVNKLQTLSERLLTLTTQKTIEMSPISLQLAVVEAVNRQFKNAKQKDIKVITRLKDATVIGNAEQLTDLFAVLLDNAIKYSPAKTKVIVSSKLTADQVIVTVKDQGGGISAEALTHIFERFYRADSSRNKQVDGYGLGLAIAKRIVEQHGGQISAASQPGKGSTFTVTLQLSGNSSAN